MTKDIGTGSTIIGMGVFSLHSIWTANAPDLIKVRDEPPGSLRIKQAILDAAILTGGAAVLVGTAAYFLTGETAPAILLLITTAALASYWVWVANAEGHISEHNVKDT